MTSALREHFGNPRNVGSVDSPEAESRAGSVTCGAVLVLTLRIDEVQKVVAARFKAAGCSRLVAACSLLTEQAEGMTTGEAAVLAQTPTKVEDKLGASPQGQEHCVALAGEALLAAIWKYSDSVRADWSGDDPLICTCFGVSEETIERTVRDAALNTVAEVTRACNAGAGCRSCHPIIQDILDELSDKLQFVEGASDWS